MLIIEFNTVALEQSEPPGNVHYPFLLYKIGLNFLAIARSKEGGIFSQVCILLSSKHHDNLCQQ